MKHCRDNEKQRINTMKDNERDAIWGHWHQNQSDKGYDDDIC